MRKANRVVATFSDGAVGYFFNDFLEKNRRFSLILCAMATVVAYGRWK
jgi:hypothetical protein